VDLVPARKAQSDIFVPCPWDHSLLELHGFEELSDAEGGEDWFPLVSPLHDSHVVSLAESYPVDSESLRELPAWDRLTFSVFTGVTAGRRIQENCIRPKYYFTGNRHQCYSREDGR
jgi:hypothetical protein